MHVSNFRNGGKLTFRGGNLTWGDFIQKMGEIGDQHATSAISPMKILNITKDHLKEMLKR